KALTSPSSTRNNWPQCAMASWGLCSRALICFHGPRPLKTWSCPLSTRTWRRTNAWSALEVLELVGLGERLGHFPSQLHGGQQQRVAIARALVNRPAILLADEPTGNLDSRTSVEIMQIFQELNDRGLTIVLVTHEPDVAQFAKRIVVFRDGKIRHDDPVLE